MKIDWSLGVGVIGVLVSLVVGLGTYYLAEKRARRRRWESAKEIILRDLSKALGEGNVPETPVILATIRSVLRSQNATNLAAVTFEEIRDDLIRQITADPFLEAARRKQLQTQVLALVPASTEINAFESDRSTFFDRASLVASVVAALVTMAAFFLPKALSFFEGSGSKDQLSKVGIIGMTAAFGIPVLVVLVFVLIEVLPTWRRRRRYRDEY